MGKRHLFVLVVGILCILTQFALGDVLSRSDLSSSGDNLLMNDLADGGLQWLNLQQTVGQSYDSVYERITTGEFVGLGFRFATEADVSKLISDVGLSVGEYSDDPAGNAMANQLCSYWGPTVVGGDGLYVGSSVSDGLGSYIHSEIATWNSPQYYRAYANISVDIGRYGGPWPYALVRTAPVPEPSTFVIFGVGAIGLLGWRRRQVA